MRPLAVTQFAALAISLAVSTVGAQQPASDSAKARGAQTLKGDLRNYVAMQERYYAGHSTYAPATSQTRLQPSAGVTLIVLSASSTGHNAVAIHRDFPDIVCGVWVGRDPRPPLYDGAQEGEPTCHGS